MSTLPRLSFGHMGIHVTNLEVMEDFYRRMLGFVVSDRGELAAGQKIVFLTQNPGAHHQIVLVTGRPETSGYNPINQISFQLDALEDLQRYRGIFEHEGRKMRPVDHGNAWSIYFKDPEGNTIEFFVDSPFYTAQPCGEPLDLTIPADEIRRRTEAMCRARPNFATREEWMASQRERIDRQRQ
jgi:catechol 2,3-dioxygenase